jgi:hypothetical protein
MAGFLASLNDNRLHVVGDDRVFTLLSAALRLRNRLLGIDAEARASTAN